MKRTDVIVIGAGQAGLAMSCQLSARGIDHVVLERRKIAQRWRSERWDSLRLLTPNWCTRLPGWQYRGSDPDGFMRMGEVVRFLEDYAAAISAPVRTGVTVESVDYLGGEWRVGTDEGMWAAQAVVIATGHCDRPRIPAMAAGLPADIRQITPSEYRNPEQLEQGGVLVVGASASGVQLADEIHASGRPVTLAAGRHIRLPRRYRGRDIVWWLDRTGLLTQPVEQMPDPVAARAQPSLQLVGDPSRASVDLGTLARTGVQVVGRAVAVEGARMRFGPDLAETVAQAERKLIRLRARVDHFVNANRLRGEVEAPEPFAPVALPEAPDEIDLKAAGIRTVVWATGYDRRYPWLKVAALDNRGELRQRGGITQWPGLYAIGLHFMRSRRSSFIDGVGDDAQALAEDILYRLDADCRMAS